MYAEFCMRHVIIEFAVHVFMQMRVALAGVFDVTRMSIYVATCFGLVAGLGFDSYIDIVMHLAASNSVF